MSKASGMPQDDVDTFTPLNYFQFFWKDSLHEVLAEQTNLYSIQKTDNVVNINKNEIKQFIGIQIYMSIIALPAHFMYWSEKTRYAPISDVMKINKYRKLREFIHAADNLQKDNLENKNKRLYKIAPVTTHVRDNLEPECDNSVDEQIIPAKTKYSGIKQCNPKKPVRLGYKKFVCAGSSGMIYDFFLYTGSLTKTEKCTGAFFVKKLIETLPKQLNFRLYFDNWLCTVDLCRELIKSLGFPTVATIRSDRLQGCNLSSEKQLTTFGKGRSSFKTDANSGAFITRWYDNDVHEVKRWDRSKKESISIKCPKVVRNCNKSMGGV